MYSEYVKEKEGLETLMTEVGFGAYQVSSVAKIFEIGDFYIKPEFRNGVKSVKFFNELVQKAKELKCNQVVCCVDTNQKNPEMSLHAVLRVGFKIKSINSGIIYFYKYI